MSEEAEQNFPLSITRGYYVVFDRMTAFRVAEPEGQRPLRVGEEASDWMARHGIIVRDDYLIEAFCFPCRVFSYRNLFSALLIQDGMATDLHRKKGLIYFGTRCDKCKGTITGQRLLRKLEPKGSQKKMLIRTMSFSGIASRAEKASQERMV